MLIHGDHDPTTFAICSTTDALGDDEILLVRDVLDTQIVDVVGQRLARVADVVLTRTRRRPARTGRRRGRLRRRCYGDWACADWRLAPARTCVAWTDLHLTSERGHAVQLATPRSAVHHLDAAGLAALVSRLDIESATEVLAATGPARCRRRGPRRPSRQSESACSGRCPTPMPPNRSWPPCLPSTHPDGGSASRTLLRCSGDDSSAPACGRVAVIQPVADGLTGGGATP